MSEASKYENGLTSILGKDQEELLLSICREVVAEDFQAILRAGVTPTNALDYWACEILGVTQREWANIRDVSGSVVSKGVRTARRDLECHEVGP